MDSMSGKHLYFLAAGLAVTAVLCLIIAASLGPDLRSHVSDNYQQYSSGRYTCSGSPTKVAEDLSQYKKPDAKTSDRGTEYLRYDDDIAIVGPDGTRPCTIRLEGLDEGYSHGTYIFLGPGFSPGSPAGGAGGSRGGPGGTK